MWAWIAVVSLFLFLTPPLHGTYIRTAFPFLLVVPVSWVALRMSLRSAYTLVTLMSVVATVGTVAGYGPFQQQSFTNPLQLVGTLVVLLAIEQRRRAAGALAENVEALQHMTLDIAAARDEAQQANKAKSMLLANVSHELRTPLNAIIGFSDLMRHEMFGPLGHPKYQGYAGDIQKSGSLLLSLINDLLDATKLEAGRYELTEAACDLGAILREAIALVKVQAEQGGVTLDVTVSDTLPPVLADERGLRQIALNLLSNAVKFTPEGGRVSVACRLDELGRPVLTVADTGRGIPEEEIPDLFQPFARAEAAKRAGTPGTGLGLVIVKSLVELHQGRIALESRVGIGTTVTVTLPRERVIAAPDTRSNVAHPHKADAI